MFIAFLCAVAAIAFLIRGTVTVAIILGIVAAGVFVINTMGGDGLIAKFLRKKLGLGPRRIANADLVAHYSSSPVVAQIVQQIRERGAEEEIGITKDGKELIARGRGSGAHVHYVFTKNGYQPLNMAEQVSFLVAVVEQLPHADTYEIDHNYREDSTPVVLYLARTSFYWDNQYHWNPNTRTWEKRTKL